MCSEITFSIEKFRTKLLFVLYRGAMGIMIQYKSALPHRANRYSPLFA